MIETCGRKAKYLGRLQRIEVKGQDGAYPFCEECTYNGDHVVRYKDPKVPSLGTYHAWDERRLSAQFIADVLDDQVERACVLPKKPVHRSDLCEICSSTAEA